MTPRTALPPHRIDLQNLGGTYTRLVDLDGDGRPELVLLQPSTSSISDNPGVDEAERKHFCLSALDLDGRLRWQIGTPWPDVECPYIRHGGGGIAIADLDDDGRLEVAAINRDELLILDGATGRERARTRLPADCYALINTARLGEHGLHLVLKVSGRTYASWPYANPVLILNPDLSVYREPFAVRGAGHNIVALDVNGDGRDELLIGYALLDHRGEVIWQLDLGPDFDYEKHHADQITLADLDGDGRPSVCYSGSEDFYIVDLDGRLRSTTPAGHSQKAHAGPWGPDGKICIFMSEKHRGINALAADGSVIWHRDDRNGYVQPGPRWSHGAGQRSWPLFRPQLPPVGEVPFRSDPALSRQLWPRFLDAEGELYEALPWQEDYALPAMTIRARRSYDCGLIYQTSIVDLDGDGLDAVLVHNRQQAWIFRSPESVATLAKESNRSTH